MFISNFDMTTITRFLGFLIFTAAFYIAGLFVTFYFIPTKYTIFLNSSFGLKGKLDLRLQEVEAYKNVDILFLGASDAYRGFDPRIFNAAGYSVFNLGSSVQTPIQTELLLEWYLDSLSPKLVVYAVHPTILNSSGSESSCDLIYQSAFQQDLLQLLKHEPNLKMINTLLYKSTLTALHLDARQWPGTVQKDVYIPGGFCENVDSNAFDLWAGRHEVIPFDTPHAYQSQAIETAIGRVKQRNIPVLLVLTPRIRDDQTLTTLRTETRLQFEKYGPVVIANDLTSFSDSLHFYDANHLSQRGVEKFNSALLPIVDSILALR